MKQFHFLCDQDGVLDDFTASALDILNKAYGKNITIEEYASNYGKWDIASFYNISDDDFWKHIESVPDLWINLSPIPWHKDLFNALKSIGHVTIVTSPSNDPECFKQKMMWLKKHLGLTSDEVFMGPRKYLMAGNGILIDDSIKNTELFKLNGGEAILVPSTWNTLDLTFEQVWNTIKEFLSVNYPYFNT